MNKPKKNLLFLFSYEKKGETLDPRIREDDRAMEPETIYEDPESSSGGRECWIRDLRRNGSVRSVLFFAIVSIFHNIQGMYGYIAGNILAIDGITVTLLATGTGIGFDILVSPTVISGIHGRETLELWIHHHITDAGQTLFGFSSQSERGLFRQLLKVNGIGGKSALSLLGLGEENLARAIQFEDDTLLSSVPGIGKKTAQKIIVDLKGSIDLSKKTSSEKTAKNTTDITLITSLIGMGYDKTRVEEVVGDIDTTLSIEIRTVEAIRRLAK